MLADKNINNLAQKKTDNNGCYAQHNYHAPLIFNIVSGAQNFKHGGIRMTKTQTMSIKEFMSGEWKQPKINKTIRDLKRFGVTAYSVNGVVMIAMAESLLVQGSQDTFENVWEAIMRAFDWGVVLVITFAGAAWALGHRSKAIEILIGVCCGYILARHAKDIRDFLKGI